MGMNILRDSGAGYRDNPKTGCHPVTLMVDEAVLYATASREFH